MKRLSLNYSPSTDQCINVEKYEARGEKNHSNGCEEIISGIHIGLGIEAVLTARVECVTIHGAVGIILKKYRLLQLGKKKKK